MSVEAGRLGLGNLVRATRKEGYLKPPSLETKKWPAPPMEQRGQAVKETVTTTRKRLEHDLERQLNDAWAVQLEPSLTKHRAVDVWIFNSEHW